MNPRVPQHRNITFGNDDSDDEDVTDSHDLQLGQPDVQVSHDPQPGEAAHGTQPWLHRQPAQAINPPLLNAARKSNRNRKDTPTFQARMHGTALHPDPLSCQALPSFATKGASFDPKLVPFLIIVKYLLIK